MNHWMNMYVNEKDARFGFTTNVTVICTGATPLGEVHLPFDPITVSTPLRCLT